MNPEAPSAIPTVTLKIERRSSHLDFPEDGREARDPHSAGAVVDIVEKSGNWVGRGFYNGHSRISLRLLTANRDEAIDAAFFARTIGSAVAFRRETLKLDEVTNAYRLVHSEADGLSGLVVDRFGVTVVLEFFAAGMFKQRTAIMDALRVHYPAARFYYFAEEHVGKQESFDCRAPEPPPPDVVTEYGLKFRVAPGSKHKTGFFVDQRDNRATLSTFCAGKRSSTSAATPAASASTRRRRGRGGSSASISMSRPSTWRSRTRSSTARRSATSRRTSSRGSAT